MTHATHLPAVAPPAPAPAPADVSRRLYQAVIGPHAQQRYLRVFAAFDARGRAGPGWHWPACISALNWLVFRRMGLVAWGWAGLAALGTLAVLGVARLVLGASNPQLGWLLLGLLLAASAAWGLLADALYYRVCNRRILQAVADSPHLDAACRTLAAQAPRAPGPRLVALNTVLGLAAAGAVLLLQGAAPPEPRGVTLVQASPAAVGTVAPAGEAAPPAADPGASAAASAAVPASTPCTTCSPAPADAASATAPPASAAQAMHEAPASPVPVPPPPAAASTERPRRGFAVQVGMFAQSANARKVLDTLKAARIEAYAEAAPQAPEHQRVRAGPFGTQDQARRAAERIRALDLPAVVVRLRD